MSGVVIRLVVNSFTVVSWSENDARQVPDMSGVEIRLVVNLSTEMPWSENDARRVPDMSGVVIRLVVNLVHCSVLVWKKNDAV